MKCSIVNCPGEYQKMQITQHFRRHGHLVLVEGISADVCDTCGDVLLSAATLEQIEEALGGSREPVETAPVYRLAAG